MMEKLCTGQGSGGMWGRGPSESGALVQLISKLPRYLGEITFPGSEGEIWVRSVILKVCPRNGNTEISWEFIRNTEYQPHSETLNQQLWGKAQPYVFSLAL